MQEKELEAINRGRSAGLAYEFADPFLKEAEDSALEEMKYSVRAGKATLDFLLSKVATLNAIQDIRNSMKSKIENKNRVISKEKTNDSRRT